MGIAAHTGLPRTTAETPSGSKEPNPVSGRQSGHAEAHQLGNSLIEGEEIPVIAGTMATWHAEHPFLCFISEQPL